jgi:Putative Ig domain/Beta-propeller repeat
MRIRQWLVAFSVCALGALAVPSVDAGPAGPSQAPSRPAAGPGATPLRLEANRGQSAPGVDLIARCRGYMAWILPTEVVFCLPRPGSPRAAGDPPGHRPEPMTADVLRMRLAQAESRPCETAGRLPGASNYLVGNDPAKWVIGAPSYANARYGDVWPGVDVTYRGEGRGLRFDFDVAPGADASAIALAFDGADAVEVDGSGALRVRMPVGDVVVSPPVAFETRGSGQRPVTARWTMRGGSRAGFDVADRDPGARLTIDPSVSYSTYFGGSSDDDSYGLGVDSSGNAYLAGTTVSTDLPTTTGAYLMTKQQNSGSTVRRDAYCVKFNSTGSVLSYATYFGGTHDDYNYGLAVSASGNAYLQGMTYATDFPATSGAAETSMGASGGALYVAKLNTSGTGLVYATFVNYGYIGQGIAIDSSGSAYIVAKSLGAAGRLRVHKLNASGSGYSYTSNQGVSGATWEYATGIAVDSSGNAYVTGYTDQSGFPTTNGAFQTTYGGGGYDAFVLKLGSTGTLQYSTLLGGTDDDYAYGVAVDSSGRAHVVGATKSSNFPTANAYQSTLGAPSGGFVTQLGSGGNSLGFSTFLSGTLGDGAAAVALGPTSVYVVGGAHSTDFPVTSNAVQSSIASAAGADAFLTVLRSQGSMEYSTYYGGDLGDNTALQSVAVDSNGDAYVATTSYSIDFPTVSAYDTTRGGTIDATVTKFTGLIRPFVVTSDTLPVWTAGVGFSRQLATTGAVGSTTWTLSAGALPTGMSVSSSGLVSGAPGEPGTFSFTATATDACQQTAERTFALTVNPPPALGSVPQQRWTRTRPYSFQLTSTGGTPPLTYSLDSGAIPDGLAVGANGAIDGTPAVTGSFVFDVRVTDLRGAVATRTVAFTVLEVPTITTASVADCTEHVTHSVPFAAKDGLAPLAWSVAAGTFPFTKTVNAATGVANAITIDAGQHTFTLRVTDAAGAVAERELTMLLNPFPAFDIAAFGVAVAGRPYSVTLLGHGGTPPVKWRLRTALPAGLSIDPDSGVISGEPSLPGSTALSVAYEDDCGGVAERAFQLDVAAVADLSRRKAKLASEFDTAELRHPRFFALELIEGTVLGAVVKGQGKGALAVDVALLDPSFAPLDLTGVGAAAGNSFKITKFTVPATGRYTLRLSPRQPFVGKVSTSISVAAASSFGGTLRLDAAEPPSDLRIPVLAGAQLSLAVKGAKGSALSPSIVAVTQDGADLLVPSDVKGAGLVRTLKLRADLVAGEVRVRLGAAPGTSGDATWSVKLKQPKTYAFSMPDVAAGE